MAFEVKQLFFQSLHVKATLKDWNLQIIAMMAITISHDFKLTKTYTTFCIARQLIVITKENELF